MPRISGEQARAREHGIIVCPDCHSRVIAPDACACGWDGAALLVDRTLSSRHDFMCTGPERVFMVPSTRRRGRAEDLRP